MIGMTKGRERWRGGGVGGAGGWGVRERQVKGMKGREICVLLKYINCPALDLRVDC